jgi:phage tail-like protein
MSCVSGKPTFRLLDGYVGWETFNVAGLTGYDLENSPGISLAQIDLNAVNPADITATLLPSRLAEGCAACEWFLVTPCQPHSDVLHRDACHVDWHSLWEHDNRPGFVDAVAVAAWRELLAVADHGANRIEIWTRKGTRRIATIAIAQPGPLAFTRKGELLATTAAANKIARFGIDGAQRGWIKAELHDPVNRIAVDSCDRIWAVTNGANGTWELWSARREDSVFTQGHVAQLKSAFPSPTGLAAESSAGFCFDQPSASGFEPSTCFSWCGKPLCDDTVEEPKSPAVAAEGQLLTNALDSGIPRCRWHRVQVDADMPQGTSIQVAVATAEEPTPTSQGDPSREPDWSNFAAGLPHPNDWHPLAPGSLNALIDCPPGRYLFFRLRLVGDGLATPVVRRIRIDFPRVTSLERLPEVYRENPRAEDFTERFLSLFDASIGDLDRIIERYPALLDPSGVPQQLLPWLAGFFDIGLEATWDETRRRKIIQRAPSLYRERGTLKGLQDAIDLVFGIKPYIEETSPTGPWGAVGSRASICRSQAHSQKATDNSSDCTGNKSRAGVSGTAYTPPPSVQRTARLGNVRLFGEARVRFRVGRSALGAAPLRSYGNPDLDPFAAGAYRFRVLVPPLPNDSPEERQRLMALINAQKPAHTVASIRVGGAGFLLGFTSTVGVDTLFASLAPPRLGAAGNIRLNRQSILWRGMRSTGGTTSVGQASVVGIQTIAG